MESKASPVLAGLPMGSAEEVLAQAVWLVEAGGPVVAILMAMSVVAMAIILVKLYQFSTVRIGERRFVEPALAEHRRDAPEKALAVLAGARNPIARVLETAIRAEARMRVADETVREEVVRVANLYLERLRSYLRALEVIGTLSPLLGLFGTVLGMIAAFQQLEASGNQVNAGLLSRGIWEALLTTAVGLTVAIPTVAAATWLERRVDRLAHDMEDAATKVFTAVLLRSPESDADTTGERARAGHSD
jgi:biopolymer transport protein ExbB